MSGIYRVIIQNKRIRYDFELKRNLTILRGDSATGKTTLVDMIREYINNREDDSIELVCDKQCYVVEGATWKGQLSIINDRIL
jgi:predicted ATP-binding protein involved in virulence